MFQPNLLQDYLHQSVNAYPDKVAVIFENMYFTYSDIERMSNYMMQNLKECSICKGERVIIKLGNCVDAIVAFWAVLKLDAIVSIIDANTKLDKLIYILNNSSASVLITNKIEDDVMNVLSKNCSNLRNVLMPYCNNNIAKEIQPLMIKYYSVDNDSKNDKYNHKVFYENISSDIAMIIYTSGSTGEPKGVTLTHRNMLVASHSINTYLENKEEDIVLCALPLSFDYGLYQMIMSISMGATLVLEKDFVWPHLFLKQIQKNKVTAIPLVPSMVGLLQKAISIAKYDYSTVRYVTNTGAALSIDHISILKNIFPNAEIFSMYGLTECKRCTYLPPKYIETKPTSVGIAIPNTELWIVDENNNKVGPNVVGQLVIRGETIMKYYWNNPIATKEKLKYDPYYDEYLLYTGDFAELDQEGFLYYRGRADEVIKSRGVKVSPKEIEDIIMLLPQVNEVAVFGKENNIYGEEICAVISVKDQKNIQCSDITNICQKFLEKEKIPTYIKFLSVLPKNTNGKIDKIVLKSSLT